MGIFKESEIKEAIRRYMIDLDTYWIANPINAYLFKYGIEQFDPDDKIFKQVFNECKQTAAMDYAKGYIKYPSHKIYGDLAIYYCFIYMYTYTDNLLIDRGYFNGNPIAKYNPSKSQGKYYECYDINDDGLALARISFGVSMAAEDIIRVEHREENLDVVRNKEVKIVRYRP